MGRLGTIVVFASSGDRWRLTDLRVLIFAGLALEGLAALAMLGFRDSAILSKEEPRASPKTVDSRSSRDATGATRDGRRVDEGAPADHPPAPHPRAWMVNWILFASSICFGVGSGMTVKYFPLFFKEDLQLSPAAVQAVFVLTPAANAALSSIGLRMSSRFGRVQTLMILRASSILLLVVIGTVSMRLRTSHLLAGWGDAMAKRLVIGVILVLYLVRSALANAPTPISTSISMDFVPSSQRARWSSLGSITQACWSVSAAVGGVLADQYGYAIVFMLTAAFHLMGTLIQAMLLPIVPRRE